MVRPYDYGQKASFPMKPFSRFKLLAWCCLLGGFALPVPAQTVTNLYSFTGTNDGAGPRGPMTLGVDGNLYGTTISGGSNNVGTFFRFTPGGSLTNLYSFIGTNQSNPIGNLVQGSDTNFYGTAGAGGPNSNGTVYVVSPAGNFTNIHIFNGLDGTGPYTGMMIGSDSNFYGATLLGGAYNAGTIFRITPSGTFSNLYSFAGIPDGAGPTRLVQGKDGNYYGTATGGGTNSMISGGQTNYPFGTVFRMTPSGSVTNLHNFTGADGWQPTGSLALGNDGNFYGTTYMGGSSNLGTVFMITPGGNFTNLYSFTGTNDGAGPVFAPLLGNDGNFYGTTLAGGISNKGTVFVITPGGSLTNLYSFTGKPDGQSPVAGLVAGNDGNYYGSTTLGGTSNRGTLFRINVTPANRISAIVRVDTNILVSIPAVAGDSYQLQFRTSLTTGTWSNIAGAFVSNSLGGLLTLTNFGGALQPQGFFRFSITP